MLTVLSQAPFVDRSNLAKHLEKLGLNTPSSIAVEIGTHRGEFAVELLKSWKGKLHCVDHWRSGYDASDPASRGDREADYQRAKQLLAPYDDRVVIHRLSSSQASQHFQLESIDLCYLDGCHQYLSVLQDLVCWYRCIKPNGVFAGHDIICPNEVNGGWAQTVQPAVLDFFNRLGYPSVGLVIERDNGPWSWFVWKCK